MRYLTRAFLWMVTVVLSVGSATIPAEAATSLSWSAPAAFDLGRTPSAVSCPTESLCVAVDRQGDALATFDPTVSIPSWSASPIDPGQSLNGVSCAPATGSAAAGSRAAGSAAAGSLCVAIDGRGYAFVGYATSLSTWSSSSIDGGRALTGISCPTVSLCVAVDEAGDVLSNLSPGSSGWTPAAIDPGRHLRAVSCSSPSLCVAVDDAGNMLSSVDPAGGVAAWRIQRVDFGELSAVSCSTAVCVAVDSFGDALSSVDPTSAAATWNMTPVDGGRLTGVSCTSWQVCVVVDAGGSSLATNAPSAPIPLWNLSTVDTQPLADVSCLSGDFCMAVDTAGRSLTTPIPPATEPPPPAPPIPLPAAPAPAHPSITGIPAPGQRLTCHPGISPGASVQLSYAWLRDLIPIPASTASTYTVKFQDSGHHLQCQVTATSGGAGTTAKSAFVTIPVGGVPAAVGETLVGKATLKHGKLSVPVLCSPHASSGCQLTLQLSTAGIGNARRSTPLSLAHLRLHLGANAHRTIMLALSARARHLLRAAGRRLPVFLYVSGTVIGIIEAPLSRQNLTLGGSSSSRALSTRRSYRASAAATSVLAATPYMGWDSYFALGGHYSEATILQQASQLVSLGLERRGYRYVWLDVGWWHGTRDSAGQITVSPTQWPHGMAWLTHTLHAAGLLVGLYTDAGPDGCGGGGQGSYGHYQQDVNTFAMWGFDAVKFDFCGGAEHQLNPASAYGAVHAAIAANSSRRPMLLSICNFLQPEQYSETQPGLSDSAFSSYTFGPSVGNSWRTDTDVGFPGKVSFGDVLRNMDADAATPQAAGPGHWNDPDYLAPDQGMSATQFRSQLSMWAMLAAPLMISDDLTRIGLASLAAVQNNSLTALDQDPGGLQATLLSTAGNGQVWVKPLIDGTRAVALLNRGSSWTRIETSANAIGLGGASSYRLLDLWTNKQSATRGSIGAEVPGDGTVLLRVSAR